MGNWECEKGSKKWNRNREWENENGNGKTDSPPCEGGVAAPSRKSFRSEMGADGVVAHAKRFAERTTPSAPLRWLRIVLLMAQPPLLSQEGNPFSHSHSVSRSHSDFPFRFPIPIPIPTSPLSFLIPTPLSLPLTSAQTAVNARGRSVRENSGPFRCLP